MVRNGPRERYKPFLPKYPEKKDLSGQKDEAQKADPQGGEDHGPLAPDAVPVEDDRFKPEEDPLATDADVLPDEGFDPESDRTGNDVNDI